MSYMPIDMKAKFTVLLPFLRLASLKSFAEVNSIVPFLREMLWRHEITVNLSNFCSKMIRIQINIKG